jgi:hypothetical protein
MLSLVLGSLCSFCLVIKKKFQSPRSISRLRGVCDSGPVHSDRPWSASVDTWEFCQFSAPEILLQSGFMFISRLINPKATLRFRLFIRLMGQARVTVNKMRRNIKRFFFPYECCEAVIVVTSIKRNVELSRFHSYEYTGIIQLLYHIIQCRHSVQQKLMC